MVKRTGRKHRFSFHSILADYYSFQLMCQNGHPEDTIHFRLSIFKAELAKLQMSIAVDKFIGWCPRLCRWGQYRTWQPDNRHAIKEDELLSVVFAAGKQIISKDHTEFPISKAQIARYFSFRHVYKEL